MIKATLKVALLAVVLGGCSFGVALANDDTAPVVQEREGIVAYLQKLDPQITAAYAVTSTFMALVGIFAWHAIMAHVDAVAHGAGNQAALIAAAIAAKNVLSAGGEEGDIELKEFAGEEQ